MAALFAISSAFLYGVSSVITRLGLKYATIMSAVLISLLSCVVCSFVLCLSLFSISQIFSGPILLFLAAGIAGPFFGRLFLYEGINRVGVSIASTLYETKPLFSLIGAVFILGEGISSMIVVGMFLMMIGTAIISLEESGGQIQRRWSRRDLVIPLASGACYGLAHIFRKGGLNVFPEPIVGVTMQNLGALAFVPFLALTRRRQKETFSANGKAWFIFSLAGILHVIAQWCLFVALDLGKVVIISPLSSLSTFFVLILSALFLRRIEKVTWKIFIGSVLIVGGTFTLALMP